MNICRECGLGSEGVVKRTVSSDTPAYHGADDDREDTQSPVQVADDVRCDCADASNIDTVVRTLFVDKREASSETQACPGADDDRGDTQSPVQLTDVRCVCAGESASGDEEKGKDEVCAICFDAYDNPVQLSCGHSFCEVCLDGWHAKSKYDASQPRNCPMCRHRVKPSQEVISQLVALSRTARKLEHEELVGGQLPHGGAKLEAAKMEVAGLLGALSKMGYSAEEIADMIRERPEGTMPIFIENAAGTNDAQTILDWLGSPVDTGKLASSSAGVTILHITAMQGHKELTRLLLQHGAALDAIDSYGGTPIVQTLWLSRGLVNETVTLLYEWGASLEHCAPDGENVDALLATTPMFQNELVKRRCEIVNLNHRKDLIGQTCIVEKYIAKKDRYKVTTEHAHETFLVGRDNLKRRDRTPEDPGYYVTFEAGKYRRHTFSSNEECQEFVRSLRACQK